MVRKPVICSVRMMIRCKCITYTFSGSLFASIACLDELVAAISGLIYGKLYTLSVGWFPGFIFLFMAGILCLTFVGSL